MKFLSTLALGILLTTNAFAAGAKDGREKHREFFKKELNLSEEQLAKIKDMRGNKDEMRASKERFKALKKDFREAMKNPQATKEELSAKFEAFQTARDEFQRKRFQRMMDMRSVLTPEQITKFAELKEKRRGKKFKGERK